jgi:hypothetical protein
MRLTSWNHTVARFLDPPVFTWEPIGDATFYRARVAGRGGAVLWEGVLEHERFDFASFWDRVPVGEVAWAVTAWGAEGQLFGETGVRRFHRVEEWCGAAGPADPTTWRRAAERNLAFLQSFRGPDLGFFHRDAPPGTVGLPHDPDALPGRWHESLLEGRYLSLRSHPLRDLPAVIDAFLAGAASGESSKAATWLGHAVKAGEALMQLPWREGVLEVTHAAHAAASLLRLAYVSHCPEFEERGREIARVLGERQDEDGSWPARVEGGTGEALTARERVAATPAAFLEDVAECYGERSCARIADRARAWLRAGPIRTHEWWASTGEDDAHDLCSTEPLAAIRLLLTDPSLDAAGIEEVVHLHRWVENAFVSYGADGSLAEEPHVPGLRERASEPWIRESAAARWLDALQMLHLVTGDAGYLGRGDAAANALARSQRPDGRFASFGMDCRLGQSGRNEDRFGDNALAAAALIRWHLHRRQP